MNKYMNEKPYVISICGCKNSGKTTLISKLLDKFSKQGYKVATIKHDGHDFQSDIIGTDTYKHRQHGAYGTAIFSKNKFMIIKEQKDTNEQELINLFPEADLIILEGFKNSDYPKYEIVRRENSNTSICNKNNLIAVLSDMKYIEGIDRIIDLNDIDFIAQDILKQLKI